ncbi:hypothetical protein ACWCXK_05985 [Streptomyces sp. NPDC001739]
MPVSRLLEFLLTTRSFIARPTYPGYSGIYVHFDGVPSHHLPLLLAAYQGRFKRSVEAMTRHLIDDVAVGWDELGTDLLDGSPPALVAALTGGEQWPSRTLDDLITPDGSPPRKMTVTDDTVDDQNLQWGYVLHPRGIEVISLFHDDGGPVVGWNTDPRTKFSDSRAHWASHKPVPGVPPARATPPPVSVSSAPPQPPHSPRPAVRR